MQRILQLGLQLLQRLQGEQQRQGAPLRPCIRVALALADFVDRGWGGPQGTSAGGRDITGFFTKQQKRERHGGSLGPPGAPGVSDASGPPATVAPTTAPGEPAALTPSGAPEGPSPQQEAQGPLTLLAVGDDPQEEAEGPPPRAQEEQEGPPEMQAPPVSPPPGALWREERCISVSSQASGGGDSDEDVKVLEIINVCDEAETLLNSGVHTPEINRREKTREKIDLNKKPAARRIPKPMRSPAAAATTAAAAATAATVAAARAAAQQQRGTSSIQRRAAPLPESGQLKIDIFLPRKRHQTLNPKP